MHAVEWRALVYEEGCETNFRKYAFLREASQASSRGSGADTLRRDVARIGLVAHKAGNSRVSGNNLTQRARSDAVDTRMGLPGIAQPVFNAKASDPRPLSMWPHVAIIH